MLVPQHLQFAPPNGKEYQDGDWKQLCQMTPISIWDIPPYMLGGSQVPHFLPPKLYLGWAVGKDKLFELLQRYYPDCVMLSEGSHGVVLWDSILSMPDEIIDEYRIPEELRDCVKVVQVLRPDSSLHLALCVGDNRIGILRPHTQLIERIAAKFFDGELPQWYLDPRAWTWRRKVRVLSPEEVNRWAGREFARPYPESSKSKITFFTHAM